MNYLYLALAIVCEVVATTSLKASAGFTRLTPSLLVVAGYGAAFFLMSLTLRTVPVGVAYAVWSGVGIVLISAASYFVYGQSLDAPALAGIGLILAGVVVIHGFSRSVAH